MNTPENGKYSTTSICLVDQAWNGKLRLVAALLIKNTLI
jgi:hypothetical protein